MQTNHSWALTGPGTSCEAAPAGHISQNAYPLWMWWNLLSLDAPTVVCLWALLFAHAVRISFPLVEVSVLTATVWIIYASDRMLDVLRSPAGSALSDRHNFYARNRYAVLGTLLPVTSATLWISFTKLTSETMVAGLMLCGAVLFYFQIIHAVPDLAARWFPKELVAGAIFAAGAAIPAWTRAVESQALLLPAVLLFAALCGLNCIAIECWEHHRGERRWKKPPYWLIRWADVRIARIAAFLILCVGCAGAFGPHSAGQTELLGASAVSLALLAALDWQSNALSPQALRVLADAALLTPAFFLLKSVL
ncbi:MAG: hypothetical protein ACRD4Y_01095 [Candidatus Acidiferrales bacterium]